MPGPFIPVWALSRSQNIRIGNHNSASGNHLVPQLTKNPSSAALPTPYLVDLSDGASRRDLAHHLALGSLIPAHGLRLTNSLSANVVSSTTAETLVQQLTIPANALSVGSTLRITQQGVITGTASTLTVKVRIGPLGTLSDPSFVSQVTASSTNLGYIWDVLLSTQAVGAGTAGKLMWNGQLGTHAVAPVISNNTTQANIDTTIVNVVTLSIQSSVSAAATATNSLIEFIDQAY